MKYNSCLNAEEMASLFCDVDLVVCSASTVCIEALACGAKVAVGWYVDNQKDLYDLLVDQGLAIPLGNINQFIQWTVDIASEGLNKKVIWKDIRCQYIDLFWD